MSTSPSNKAGLPLLAKASQEDGHSASPSHKEEQPSSSVTVPVTQSAVTYRQKLIQKESQINCVRRQCEVLFPIRESPVSAAPTTLFSSVTLIQMF